MQEPGTARRRGGKDGNAGGANAGGGRVADAYARNWVDDRAPAALRPYLRLSRADRPIGTWLLFLPCLWSVLLAAGATGFRAADLWLIAGMGAGAILMRGAGCTWNDLTDRDLDAQVARTRSRPLPSGQVTPRQAAVWMAAQAGIAFLILLTFNTAAILWGTASLALVAVYPFAKRFTWWPQVFLGLAFNWGALLGWVAHAGSPAAPALWLYLSGIAWTLFYDTIYAHQDKEDDALIGVRSTARLFGAATPRWMAAFLCAAVALMALAVIAALGPAGRPAAVLVALAGVAGFGGHLLWQMGRLDIDDPAACLRLFRANRDAGLVPAPFFAAALFL